MTPPSTERGFRLGGRVQGVGFRWWTQALAKELGIAGTVRNCSDGTVEVLAQGGAEALETFSAKLREGPPHARVEEVRTTEADLPPGMEGFRIIH